MIDREAAACRAVFGQTPAALAALWVSQTRNTAALFAAHRMTVAGYQDAYVRLLEHCTAATADFRNRVEAMQMRPLDLENATRLIAETGRAFDRGATELRLLSETVRAAAAGAAEILRLRAEEGAAELRAARSPSA